MAKGASSIVYISWLVVQLPSILELLMEYCRACTGPISIRVSALATYPGKACAELLLPQAWLDTGLTRGPHSDTQSCGAALDCKHQPLCLPGPSAHRQAACRC